MTMQNGYNLPMSSTLLHSDEEMDMGVYGAYLRAQSDTDLLDIALHLDPERYPARLDTAGRELNRRGLLQTSAYTPLEAAVRRLSLAALALSLIVLLLTILLTQADAAGPSWPTPDMLTDGMPMGEFTRLFSVALLRGAVIWGSHLGLFVSLPLFLGVWAIRFAVPVRRKRARADVWLLAGLGCAVLLASLGIAVGPGSAVPSLFAASVNSHSTFQRTLPLWDPFASTPAPDTQDS